MVVISKISSVILRIQWYNFAPNLAGNLPILMLRLKLGDLIDRAEALRSAKMEEARANFLSEMRSKAAASGSIWMIGLEKADAARDRTPGSNSSRRIVERRISRSWT
jgi:hypothetical protein